jgi:hypothetical protein
MDAIQAKEWRMFIILKNMKEEVASKLFIFIHFPLYVAALYALVSGGTAGFSLRIIIDVFLIGHTIIHYGFRKHNGNGFHSWYSKTIIYAMPVAAILDLWLLFAS